MKSLKTPAFVGFKHLDGNPERLISFSDLCGLKLSQWLELLWEALQICALCNKPRMYCKSYVFPLK